MAVLASVAGSVGSIAGALAIAGVAVGVLRWLSNWWTRRKLRRELTRLRDRDADLRQVVISLDELFTTGVGWSGLASWPDELGKHIARLVRTRRELDELVARVRAVWAVGSTERARDSVDAAARGLRRAVSLYLSGATERYVDSTLGEPLPQVASVKVVYEPERVTLA